MSPFPRVCAPAKHCNFLQSSPGDGCAKLRRSLARTREKRQFPAILPSAPGWRMAECVGISPRARTRAFLRYAVCIFSAAGVYRQRATIPANKGAGDDKGQRGREVLYVPSHAFLGAYSADIAANQAIYTAQSRADGGMDRRYTGTVHRPSYRSHARQQRARHAAHSGGADRPTPRTGDMGARLS